MQTRVKSLVKDGVDAAPYLSGLTSLRKRRARVGGAVVLMYHSVLDDECASWIDPTYAVTRRQFIQHVDLLIRRRNVIGIDELHAHLAEGTDPPPGSVVITFDDGYRNNLTTAAPILAAAGLPATFYLATGYVNDTESQWVDTLYSSFTRRTRDHLVLPTGRYDLGVRLQRRRAHTAMLERLLGADRADRAGILKDLDDQLQPTGTAPRLTLDWDEVRQLRGMSDGFTIGVHTRDHLDLSRLPEDAVRAEITRSIDDVQAALGVRARHFSYPYGRADASKGRVARELGLDTAVLVHQRRVIGGGSDPHMLPRLGSGTNYLLLRARSTGFSPLFDRTAIRN